MKKSRKQALAIGAGAAALAAAATGVYFMTGKHAGNRKKVAKWVGDMQKDVVKELKKAGSTSEAAYKKAVDTVAKSYKGAKKLSASDLALAAAELKGSWGAIRTEMNKAVSQVRKVTPKSVSKIAKKVVGKRAPAKRKAAKKRR